jgi:hypothetical protein
MVERRKNPARRKSTLIPDTAKIKPVEYDVVPNGARWDVDRERSFTGAFAYEVNTAIGLATAAAQREQQTGVPAMVSVQQADGTFRKVWP